MGVRDDSIHHPQGPTQQSRAMCHIKVMYKHNLYDPDCLVSECRISGLQCVYSDVLTLPLLAKSTRGHGSRWLPCSDFLLSMEGKCRIRCSYCILVAGMFITNLAR